jgi:hypothetical protein
LKAGITRQRRGRNSGERARDRESGEMEHKVRRLWPRPSPPFWNQQSDLSFHTSSHHGSLPNLELKLGSLLLELSILRVSHPHISSELPLSRSLWLSHRQIQWSAPGPTVSRCLIQPISLSSVKPLRQLASRRSHLPSLFLLPPSHSLATF